MSDKKRQNIACENCQIISISQREPSFLQFFCAEAYSNSMTTQPNQQQKFQGGESKGQGELGMSGGSAQNNNINQLSQPQGTGVEEKNVDIRPDAAPVVSVIKPATPQMPSAPAKPVQKPAQKAREEAPEGITRNQVIAAAVILLVIGIYFGTASDGEENENVAERGGTETNQLAQIGAQPAPQASAGTVTGGANVFFNSAVLDPILDCGTVFPVKRAGARTLAEAITELLKGPGAEELNAGYFTSLSPGVEVRRAEVRENGVAAIDLSEHVVSGIVPGSCRATAIRAQIMKTAQGFPDVKSVMITVGGKADHALE